METGVNRLSKEQFDKAKKFIFESGRPLDRQLYRCHFENGESELVIEELAKYQNADGGFGNALEPDLRTPLSSALATSVALRNMVEVHIEPRNKVLNKAISYLLDTIDQKNWRWVIAPEGRKNSPHAPWWGGDDIVSDFRGCFANPTAEITGYLLHYKDLVPQEVLNGLLDHLKAYLVKATKTPDGFQMHDLICYLALIHVEELEENYRNEIKPILVSAAGLIVERDRKNWTAYGARPLWLCDNPGSILYETLKEFVQDNLDYEIESQNDDGSWSPFWSWEDYDIQNWQQASREWSSHLTLINLMRLKKFDRLC